MSFALVMMSFFGITATSAHAQEACRSDRSLPGEPSSQSHDLTPWDLMSLDEVGLTYGSPVYRVPPHSSPDSPCDQTLDSGDYNLCFAANPWPMSTMPKWIAQWQAEEAVSQVFDRINSIHHSLHQQSHPSQARPLHFSPERLWLVEIAAQLDHQQLPGPPSGICIETSDESCEVPPTSALTGTSLFLSPPPIQNVQTAPTRGSPSLLVILSTPDSSGVGPSPEHRLLPDKPPRA